jgi:hypothetical protein
MANGRRRRRIAQHRNRYQVRKLVCCNDRRPQFAARFESVVREAIGAVGRCNNDWVPMTRVSGAGYLYNIMSDMRTRRLPTREPIIDPVQRLVRSYKYYLLRIAEESISALGLVWERLALLPDILRRRSGQVRPAGLEGFDATLSLS